MRFFSLILSICAKLAMGIAAAQAEIQTLTLVHPGLPGSLYDICATEFGRRLEEKLPPSHRIVVVPNPVLGDGLALLDSIKNNRATFVLASSALLSVSDQFAIFELPFLIRNRAQVRAIRKELLDGFLQPEVATKGLHILGVWESGFRQFTNDVRAIHHPRDLEGLKIAVLPANRWREKLLRTFGADPIVMAARAFPDALHTQIVNGQEAPLNEIAAFRLSEVQRHLSLSDHLYSPGFLVTSTAQLKALPADVRELIASQALAMEGWVQTTAIQMESELLDRLDQKMELTHIDVEAFKSISREIYGDFIREVRHGAKMIQIMQELDGASISDRKR